MESGQLPTTALPSNTDSELDEDSDPDEAADISVEALEMRRLRQSIAQRKKLATPSPPNNVPQGGAPERHKRTTSSGSIEDGVYSTLSNEMYSKVASPGGSVHITSPMPNLSEAVATAGNRPADKRRTREELKQRLRELALTSETGSASVIEVIEPTSSEEDEFRRSVWHEMNIKWAAAGAAAGGMAGPLAEGGSSSTVPRRRREASVRGDAGVNNRGVELSPTKRLLEMGISPSTLDDLKQEEDDGGRLMPTPRARTSLHMNTATGVEEAQDADKKGSGFFKKIANWNKRRGERKEPAGREEGDKVDGTHPCPDVLDTAEEHVLPDSFEDVAVSLPEEGMEGTGGMEGTLASPKVDFILHTRASAKTAGSVGTISSAAEGSRSSSSSGNKSLSPQSRKSLNGSKITMASEDSGIFLSKEMHGTASLSLSNGLGKIEESSLKGGPTGLPLDKGTEPGAGRVQRAVLRMNNNTRHLKHFDVNPVTILRKKSLESKAWYDVPSDEERAGGGSGGIGEQDVEDEADESLASIISTGRPSSDED